MKLIELKQKEVTRSFVDVIKSYCNEYLID